MSKNNVLPSGAFSQTRGLWQVFSTVDHWQLLAYYRKSAVVWRKWGVLGIC